jgi:hypothetical protein
MEFKDLLALLISFVALFFSFRTYKRDNRLENENQLYALKLDVYSRIIGKIANLVIMVEDNVVYAQSALKRNDIGRLDDLDDFADRLDDACEELDVFFISNSLALPEEILDLLLEFSTDVQSIETVDSLHINTGQAIERISIMKKKLVDLVNSADHISAILRKDIKVKELNDSLYTRLNKNN